MSSKSKQSLTRQPERKTQAIWVFRKPELWFLVLNKIRWQTSEIIKAFMPRVHRLQITDRLQTGLKLCVSQ